MDHWRRFKYSVVGTIATRRSTSLQPFLKNYVYGFCFACFVGLYFYPGLQWGSCILTLRQ